MRAVVLLLAPNRVHATRGIGIMGAARWERRFCAPTASTAVGGWKHPSNWGVTVLLSSPAAGPRRAWRRPPSHGHHAMHVMMG